MWPTSAARPSGTSRPGLPINTLCAMAPSCARPASRNRCLTSSLRHPAGSLRVLSGCGSDATDPAGAARIRFGTNELFRGVDMRRVRSDDHYLTARSATDCASREPKSNDPYAFFIVNPSECSAREHALKWPPRERDGHFNECMHYADAGTTQTPGRRPGQRASLPCSPVRIRARCSTGSTQTLPSPILPVRAEA